MGDDFADEIGRALRRARAGRGLTLRQVATVSGGQFKATSVAGYERAERTISVERFCRLCRLYDIAPQTVLAEVVTAVEGTVPTLIDLSRLEQITASEREIVTEFVRNIVAKRREPPTETILLREGDLEVLASEAGTTREELAEALEPAIRREP
jgi:transcriptional regulator with XRE-family HTH domain